MYLLRFVLTVPAAQIQQARVQSMALLALLTIIGIVIVTFMLANSTHDFTGGGHEGHRPYSDRELAQSVIDALQGTTEETRLNSLRSFEGALPRSLPEDCICGLLGETTENLRFEALRVLKPKLPRPISAAVLEQVVTNMSLALRDQSIELINSQ